LADPKVKGEREDIGNLKRRRLIGRGWDLEKILKTVG